MLKYSNSIREADRDYNIPQTTPRRYIIDTKKRNLEFECMQKIYCDKEDRFYVCCVWELNRTFNARPTERLQKYPLLLCNEPHRFHVLFVKGAPGTIFTCWPKNHFVTIVKPEPKVCKTSHCSSKQHVTNLRAALGRFSLGPLVAVFVLAGWEHWV